MYKPNEFWTPEDFPEGTVLHVGADDKPVKVLSSAYDDDGSVVLYVEADFEQQFRVWPASDRFEYEMQS